MDRNGIKSVIECEQLLKMIALNVVADPYRIEDGSLHLIDFQTECNAYTLEVQIDRQ